MISSGMDGMFKGCTSLTKSFGESHDEERGAQITIGPVTSKLLNGFFWWRSSVNANPDYILDADIRMRAGRSASGDVALAGPASATDLMLRPDHAGTYYDATVSDRCHQHAPPRHLARAALPQRLDRRHADRSGRGGACGLGADR